MSLIEEVLEVGEALKGILKGWEGVNVPPQLLFYCFKEEDGIVGYVFKVGHKYTWTIHNLNTDDMLGLYSLSSADYHVEGIYDIFDRGRHPIEAYDDVLLEIQNILIKESHKR